MKESDKQDLLDRATVHEAELDQFGALLEEGRRRFKDDPDMIEKIEANEELLQQYRNFYANLKTAIEES